MRGNNLKRAAEFGDGSVLKVQKIFKTLQGEGPNVGVPAIFVRLGGCNLACTFCDTDFEEFVEISLDEIIFKVRQLSLNDKNVKPEHKFSPFLEFYKEHLLHIHNHNEDIILNYFNSFRHDIKKQ